MTELPFEADERLVKIHHRAISVGLPCVWYGGYGVRPPTLKIRLPNGQSGIMFDVNEETADAFANIPFEDLIILNHYLAHWNSRRHEITASIDLKQGSRSDLWALPGAEPSYENEAKPTQKPKASHALGLDLPDFRPSPSKGRLCIQRPTSEVKVSLYSPPSSDPLLSLTSVTLHIEGIRSSNEQEAARLLFDIAHAVFFEFDVNHSITLQLAERTTVRSPLVKDAKKRHADPAYLPERRLARDAVALYMYARTIRGYPLLEFLTFYQVIEQCMMAFSRPDTIQRLRARLEDPSFDIDDNVSLSQLLAPDSRSGRTTLSERDQVRLTMRTCVTNESIREFLQSNAATADFISAQSRPLGARPVTVKDSKVRLPDQVAERIYDLRCRIVHAKGDSLDQLNGPLLPTSSEVGQLWHDLLLIRFVAQQVLMSSSIPASW